MPIESSNGLGVRSSYGPRTTAESRVGVLPSAGMVKEIQVDIRGSEYDDVQVTLPRGSFVIETIAHVQEAFDLGGTSPTIILGSTTPATNFAIVISEAQAEAAGTIVTDAPGGTVAAQPTAADITLTVTLGGTTPTITDAGKARITVRYVDGNSSADHVLGSPE